MRRWRRSAFGAAVRSLFAAGLVAMGGVAGAASPTADMPPFEAALMCFGRLTAAKRPHGDLPRLSDPDAAPALRTLWATTGAGPMANDPKATKDDLVKAAMRRSVLLIFKMHVLDTYLFFPDPTPHPENFDMAKPLPAGFDAARLAAQFGPEVAESLAASINEVADMSAAMEEDRKAGGAEARTPMGVHGARAASLRLVSLAQTFMRAPAFGPDDAARVAAAFADHGGNSAVVLSPQDRASVASSFAKSAKQLPDGPARRDIGRFVETLRTEPCGHLCSAAD